MHPRNRFWPVMAAVFGGDPGREPATRAAFALNHHVALWDVLASCDISGASDGSIRNPQPNDISMILRGAPIRLVMTTGSKAGQLYVKLVEPELKRLGIDVEMMTVASTSPANAAKSLNDLVSIYRAAFARGYRPKCVSGIGCEGLSCLACRGFESSCRHFRARPECVSGIGADPLRRKACGGFECARLVE